MPPVPQKPTRQNRRFEGITLVYLAFFLLAVLAPSIITHDYFGIPSMYLEELLIFITGLGSLMTFTLYERILEKKIQERDVATESAERAKKELVESYQYIGSMNRQMDVLKKLANETSMSLMKSSAYWKDLLHSLASNAASCVSANNVLIRFVELETLRTEREVYYHVKQRKQIKISNRELRMVCDSNIGHSQIHTESGDDVLIVTSDPTGSPMRAHVILDMPTTAISDVEISLLKVLANQAQLVYHQLAKPKTGEMFSKSPLSMIEEVTANADGDVS